MIQSTIITSHPSSRVEVIKMRATTKQTSDSSGTTADVQPSPPAGASEEQGALRGRGKRPKRESDPNAKPWLVYDLKRGYVWGPGHERWPGRVATWSGPGNQGAAGD